MLDSLQILLLPYTLTPGSVSLDKSKGNMAYAISKYVTASRAYTLVLSIGEEAVFGGFVSFFMEWLPMNVWIHKQEVYC